MGRFARTAVYFGAFAPLAGESAANRGGERGHRRGRRVVAPGNVIVGPAAVTGPLQWGSLDDVVMGGASSSAVVPIASQLEWSGTVTTANNGGFAGVRTRLISPPLDLSGATGLRLKLKGGDGMRFKFLLRDDEDWNGVGWCASFDTSKAGTDGNSLRVPRAAVRADVAAGEPPLLRRGLRDDLTLTCPSSNTTAGSTRPSRPAPFPSASSPSQRTEGWWEWESRGEGERGRALRAARPMSWRFRYHPKLVCWVLGGALFGSLSVRFCWIVGLRIVSVVVCVS